MVPTGQVLAEAADTHTSPAGLCLWVSTFSLCPYKSKINVSRVVFIAYLSFQKNCHRLPPPKLLHLEWSGLQGLLPSSPLSTISLQVPQAESSVMSQTGPLPGTPLRLLSAFQIPTSPRALISFLTPDLFYLSYVKCLWCFCLPLHSAYPVLTIAEECGLEAIRMSYTSPWMLEYLPHR